MDFLEPKRSTLVNKIFSFIYSPIANTMGHIVLHLSLVLNNKLASNLCHMETLYWFKPTL